MASDILDEYVWQGYETVEDLSFTFNRTKRRIQQVIAELTQQGKVKHAFLVKYLPKDGEVLLLGKPAYKRLDK
jgi:hypothetical protein